MGTQRRRRILVVDDEPGIRELVTAWLQFTGFDVFQASDGAQAGALAGDCHPDAIVLDLLLPGMDGYTVARRLRDDGSRVPILFLTARDGDEDRLACLSLGDGYLLKPFGLTELTNRLHALLAPVPDRADSTDRTDSTDGADDSP